jgi:hypothetical protein
MERAFRFAFNVTLAALQTIPETSLFGSTMYLDFNAFVVPKPQLTLHGNFIFGTHHREEDPWSYICGQILWRQEHPGWKVLYKPENQESVERLRTEKRMLIILNSNNARFFELPTACLHLITIYKSHEFRRLISVIISDHSTTVMMCFEILYLK